MNPNDKLIEVTFEQFTFLRSLDKQHNDMWLEAIESRGVVFSITGWDMGKGITREQKATTMLLLSKIC
jgi:hypothetical protein